MPISIDLRDDEFPEQPIEEVRKVARAVLMDAENRVCLHRVHRDDAFGNQIYYETPGGGVDENESFEAAVKRECLEETGWSVEILCYLGEVRDFYNKIGRKNINRYYLCRAVKKETSHFVSKGDFYISETSFYPLEEAIRRYRSMDSHLVSGLVQRRELPVLEAAKIEIEAPSNRKK